MKRPPEPPDHLSAEQKALWSRIARDYLLDDPGLALLRVACEALDRLAEAREIISREGVTIGEGARTRRHPALDVEKQSASIFLRAWRDLGFDKSHDALAGKGAH